MSTRADLVEAMKNQAYDYAMESYDAEETVFDQIYQTENSEGSWEQYTSAIGPGELTETGEMEGMDEVEAMEGWTVYCANRKFTKELPLSDEALRDNRQMDNFIKTWGGGLGEAGRLTKERRHANLFNYGGYTSGHAVFNNNISGGVLTTYTSPNLCYDGYPFLNKSDNTRAAKHGGAYYNGFADKGLSETNLQQLWQSIADTNSYDEAGNRVSIVPNTILCKYGSDTWWTARRIVESQAAIYEGSHPGVKNLFGSLRVIGWSFLSDADAWFLGVARKGLMSLARMPLSIDTYEDKKHDGHIIRARVRFNCCVRNWRYWVGAKFSTS